MKHARNTRTHELQALALQLLTASGADASDAVAIRSLPRAMAKRLDCSYQTAIRHIERAILQARQKGT